MRACWLKWVGRDWSISADYIWLNYSDANSISPRYFVLQVKGHEYLGTDNLYINAINPSARAFGFIIEAYVTWRRHTAC